jgi:hypothetical protein
MVNPSLALGAAVAPSIAAFVSPAMIVRKWR